MKRKQFLQTAIASASTSAALAACRTTAGASRSNASLPTLNWQMATSWPVALDTIFGGAKTFADRVAALTGGKFKITPRPAGELAPPLEVLNVVSQGAVPCGHTAAYYYVGKSPATAFGTAVPFGLNAQQQNAWLYEGGGLRHLQDLMNLLPKMLTLRAFLQNGNSSAIASLPGTTSTKAVSPATAIANSNRDLFPYQIKDY